MKAHVPNEKNEGSHNRPGTNSSSMDCFDSCSNKTRLRAHVSKHCAIFRHKVADRKSNLCPISNSRSFFSFFFRKLSFGLTLQRPTVTLAFSFFFSRRDDDRCHGNLIWWLFSPHGKKVSRTVFVVVASLSDWDARARGRVFIAEPSAWINHLRWALFFGWKF